MNRILIVATGLILLAGCASNTTFVYKPGTPVSGVRKLPVKVGVLPFQDGTEGFTARGTLFNGMTHNLAKGGISIQVDALTPELWAKAFASDMAASGAFQSARFVYSPSELAQEEFAVKGTLKKANYFTDGSKPNEFVLSLRTVRMIDNKLVWENDVVKEWTLPNDIFEGCGLGQQCKNIRLHAEINRIMQGMFAEARVDLFSTLASLSGKRAGENNIPSADSPAQPDMKSVDREIEEILKGK